MGLSLKEVEVEPSSTVETKSMTDLERCEAIKRQVEYYFSRQNLLQDTFLLSKMNKDHFVDVSVIAEFKMMKQLTSDVDLIMSSVRESDKVILDEVRKCIKPAANTERTTLILRNIPSSATEESVRALLTAANAPKMVSIRADVGDNWFLSFETTDATKVAMDLVKSLKWDGKQIGCAIKSESFLKGLALLPANGIPYHSNAFVAHGGDIGFRANSSKRVGQGRRNQHASGGVNDGADTHGRKSSPGKKSKARNGRDVVAKDGTNSPQSPTNNSRVELKASDFPVLGSTPAESAEATSAASTPPLCSTPPLVSEPNLAVAELVTSKGKVSYAQMAQSKLIAAGSPVKAQAVN